MHSFHAPHRHAHKVDTGDERRTVESGALSTNPCEWPDVQLGACAGLKQNLVQHEL